MLIDTGSILAFCALAALIFVGWRSNRGTGSDRALLKDHARLKSRLSSLEESFKGCATKADVVALAGKIDALEEHAASAGDINALEGKVNVALTEIAAVAKAADRTEAGVQRIEGFFIQKGIER